VNDHGARSTALTSAPRCHVTPTAAPAAERSPQLPRRGSAEHRPAHQRSALPRDAHSRAPRPPASPASPTSPDALWRVPVAYRHPGKGHPLRALPVPLREALRPTWTPGDAARALARSSRVLLPRQGV